jgi:hypothetical protein
MDGSTASIANFWPYAPPLFLHPQGHALERA